MASLQDLNLRKNKISIVNKLVGFVNLSKLNLGLNLIKCISNLQNSMPTLRELSLDQNPVATTLTP
jgi:Leucine-rich repeat (LRR) protein